MLGCLTDVAQNLTALPDRRKALMVDRFPHGP
jgi:hypothetical protein